MILVKTKPQYFINIFAFFHLHLFILLLFIIYCFLFVCFFTHYYSVDSSHPSSHPPSATDGAAGANATDNANASLVNGTSRTPSLFYLIDFSPYYIRFCLSLMNCTDVLCACHYPLRAPFPQALQQLMRCHKDVMTESLHLHRIKHGRTNRNYDLFAIN